MLRNLALHDCWCQKGGICSNENWGLVFLEMSSESKSVIFVFQILCALTFKLLNVSNHFLVHGDVTLLGACAASVEENVLICWLGLHTWNATTLCDVVATMFNLLTCITHKAVNISKCSVAWKSWCMIHLCKPFKRFVITHFAQRLLTSWQSWFNVFPHML